MQHELEPLKIGISGACDILGELQAKNVMCIQLGWSNSLQKQIAVQPQDSKLNSDRICIMMQMACNEQCTVLLTVVSWLLPYQEQVANAFLVLGVVL